MLFSNNMRRISSHFTLIEFISCRQNHRSVWTVRSVNEHMNNSIGKTILAIDSWSINQIFAVISPSGDRQKICVQKFTSKSDCKICGDVHKQFGCLVHCELLRNPCEDSALRRLIYKWLISLEACFNSVPALQNLWIHGVHRIARMVSFWFFLTKWISTKISCPVHCVRWMLYQVKCVTRVVVPLKITDYRGNKFKICNIYLCNCELYY